MDLGSRYKKTPSFKLKSLTFCLDFTFLPNECCKSKTSKIKSMKTHILSSREKRYTVHAHTVRDEYSTQSLQLSIVMSVSLLSSSLKG